MCLHDLLGRRERVREDELGDADSGRGGRLEVAALSSKRRERLSQRMLRRFSLIVVVAICNSKFGSE